MVILSFDPKMRDWLTDTSAVQKTQPVKHLCVVSAFVPSSAAG